MKELNRKNFLWLAFALFCVALVAFIASFIVFHFLTDTGFTTVFQLETEKPVAVAILSLFATLNLTLATLSLLIGLIFFKKS